MSEQVFDASHDTARARRSPSAMRLEPASGSSISRPARPDRIELAGAPRQSDAARDGKAAGGLEGEDFDIPTNNIEIPRSAIDRFIPELAGDVAVEAIELEQASAEGISVEDADLANHSVFPRRRFHDGPDPGPPADGGAAGAPGRGLSAGATTGSRPNIVSRPASTIASKPIGCCWARGSGRIRS